MNIEINLLLLKNSAKQNFRMLRKKSPLICTVLEAEIMVSKRFFDHIAFTSKRSKNLNDLAERLLIIPFLEKILNNGILAETRQKNKEVYYKISKEIHRQIYSVIVVKTKQKKHFLLSCFIDWENKK